MRTKKHIRERTRTLAPGRSVFNRVERRMIKFSKELSGVVLLIPSECELRND